VIYNNLRSKKRTKEINYGNRGVALESDINESNTYYVVNDIAYIYKKPTPIQVNRVNYPNRRDAVISEAYYRTPSTTDYNGIYMGKYIDFEAKETSSKTAFALANIHKHQIDHINNVLRHGGISFIIVNFTAINEVYLLDGNKLVEFVNAQPRKSIPLSYFKEYGHILKYKFNPRLDYLKIVKEKIIGDE